MLEIVHLTIDDTVLALAIDGIIGDPRTLQVVEVDGKVDAGFAQEHQEKFQYLDAANGKAGRNSH